MAPWAVKISASRDKREKKGRVGDVSASRDATLRVNISVSRDRTEIVLLISFSWPARILYYLTNVRQSIM